MIIRGFESDLVYLDLQIGVIRIGLQRLLVESERGVVIGNLFRLTSLRILGFPVFWASCHEQGKTYVQSCCTATSHEFSESRLGHEKSNTRLRGRARIRGWLSFKYNDAGGADLALKL